MFKLVSTSLNEKHKSLNENKQLKMNTYQKRSLLFQCYCWKYVFFKNFGSK